MLQDEQLNTLSDIFKDIAKGSFLAALAISATGNNWFVFIKAFGFGIACTLVSLKIVERKYK